MTVELFPRVVDALRGAEVGRCQGSTKPDKLRPLDPKTLSLRGVRAEQAKSHHGTHGLCWSRRHRLPLDLLAPIDVVLIERPEDELVRIDVKVGDVSVTRGVLSHGLSGMLADQRGDPRAIREGARLPVALLDGGAVREEGEGEARVADFQ